MVESRSKFPLVFVYSISKRLLMGTMAILLLGGCGRSEPAASASVTGSVPLTVSLPGVSSAALAQAGIYLAPPGVHPSGMPLPAVPAVVTTIGLASSSGGATSSGQTAGPLQAAVVGDKADGTLVLSASDAAAFATTHSPGFVGTPTFSQPTAVQFYDIATSPPVEATAWAIVVSGTMRLSGPAPTNGGEATATPTMSTAVLFIDAVNGSFLTELKVS
jgi:hypothetical protein